MTTPNTGSVDFPTTANEFYKGVETLAVQNIRSVESTNKIEDAFYEYPVDEKTGNVIQEALIAMAEAQAFVPTADGEQPDLSPKDPKLFVRYFNNFEAKQFKTTTRPDEIRKIIAGYNANSADNGTEGVTAKIIGTLTSGEGDFDYSQMRAIIEDANVGISAESAVLGGRRPTNMKGVMYAIRRMYNAIKATNEIGLEANMSCKQGVPVDDIRIAISEDVLALIDMVELASLFHLTKEELLGKVVTLPTDGNYSGHKVLVYDRKALGRATRLFVYSQDVLGTQRYLNHALNTERAYFYNKLYKALKLDISAAVEAAEGDILEAVGA